MTEADATRTSRRAALVAGGLGLAVLAGCGPQGEPGAAGGAPAAGGAAAPGGAARSRLRIGTSFVVSNMVPGDNPQWHATYGVAQTLYRILPEDRLAPWIASSIAPDGQEGYTIKLNPAARFHNGKRIDAAAVQACIERHLARGVQVPSLKGARWEVVDPGTLRVKTVEPDPSALVGKGYYSGPFRASALTADRLTLDAVPDAWDGAPKLAGVDVAFIRDPLARFNALKTGEIDQMLYTASDALPQIKATPGLHSKATPTAELVWVQLNHRRPPFDEVAVRQALAAAIDRQPIATTVLNGAYDAFDSVYPPTLPWALRGVLKYDAAGAKKLLDDAGIRYNSMQKTGNPMSILNTNFRTDSPGNEGGWGSAELDALIRRLNVEFDERARADQLRQVQEHFRKEVPITFGVSKRWSATVVDAYSDYVASHDNHAYVVTRDTAPAPGKAR